MPENVYEKTRVAVVQDVPTDIVGRVLAGLKDKFPTYETGKGEAVKTHDTQFVVAGKGDYSRIEHDGRIGAPLKGKMAAFAAGIAWQIGQNILAEAE